MSLSTTNSLSTSSERRLASTAHGEIAYRETGSGPAAIFIHGVFLNADLWDAQLRDLADLRRCIAPDLLAHGQSPVGSELTLAKQAEMIISFIDAVVGDGQAEAGDRDAGAGNGTAGAGNGQVDLIGNDTGGAIAQLVAVAIPDRVRSLTLTNCDTDENLPPAAFQPIIDLARAGELAGAMPAIAASPELARASLASSLEHPEAIGDDVLTGFFAPFTDPARAAAVQAYVAGMNNEVTVAIRDSLARLQAPTLIVWGTGDEFFDLSWARWLADTIPGTMRLVTVDGGRLFFPLERPAELSQPLRELWQES
jgi:pimeloyl-ACP methyl ester carboxylesterase